MINSKYLRTTLILIILLAALLLVIFVKRKVPSSEKVTQPFVTRCGEYAMTTISVASTTITAEVADTSCKQELGLSGQNSLGNNQGMLFVFPKEGNYGFWMKDMNFALDMVWVSSSTQISGIEKNVPVASYPEAFGEKYLAQYVIELPAGFIDAHHLVVGEKIFLSTISL